MTFFALPSLLGAKVFSAFKTCGKDRPKKDKVPTPIKSLLFMYLLINYFFCSSNLSAIELNIPACILTISF